MLPSIKPWLLTSVTDALSSPLCSFRGSEVLPARAARAADDVRALQRLDPGLQVCFSLRVIVGCCRQHVPSQLLCVFSAASKTKTRGCRLSSTPARSCPRPTTTTSSEFNARPLDPLSFRRQMAPFVQAPHRGRRLKRPL